MPPRDDEYVIVQEGQTVMIDGETNNMKMLLIDGGTLLFDNDQDCHLQAQNILVVYEDSWHALR